MISVPPPPIGVMNHEFTVARVGTRGLARNKVCSVLKVHRRAWPKDRGPLRKRTLGQGHTFEGPASVSVSSGWIINYSWLEFCDNLLLPKRCYGLQGGWLLIPIIVYGISFSIKIWFMKLGRRYQDRLQIKENKFF